MGESDTIDEQRQPQLTSHVLKRIERGVIVSCQASPGDPTDSVAFIQAFARAAELGGAAGLRLNGAEHIVAVRTITTLPIIGIQKHRDEDGSVTITGAIREIQPLVMAGAEIIAFGAEQRLGPTLLRELTAEIHRLGAYAMADLRLFEDAEQMVALGVDILATTLSVFDLPPYQPNIQLISRLVKAYALPVIAEGNYWDPQDVRRAFEAGAFAVVIGSAVTRPWLITERYVQEARHYFGR